VTIVVIPSGGLVFQDFLDFLIFSLSSSFSSSFSSSPPPLLLAFSRFGFKNPFYRKKKKLELVISDKDYDYGDDEDNYEM